MLPITHSPTTTQFPARGTGHTPMPPRGHQLRLADPTQPDSAEDQARLTPAEGEGWAHRYAPIAGRAIVELTLFAGVAWVLWWTVTLAIR